MSDQSANSVTYELKLTAKSSEDKTKILDYLYLNYKGSFVEGSVDNLFLDDNTDCFSNYDYLEKNLSSISIYKYNKKDLLQIEEDLKSRFQDKISSQIIESSSQDWKTGWKENFCPVTTKRFRVYPPWKMPDSSYINIKIDPGMAFGTGQHESSRLCLSAIEYVADIHPDIKSCLDIGTGSGILAIGMKKIFNCQLVATDIDSDAISSARENAELNNVQIDLQHTSIPHFDTKISFDLVVSNILAPVLKQIISDVDLLTHQGSFYIIAGILDEDVKEICDLYLSFSFSCIKTFSEKGWSCCLFQKL